MTSYNESNITLRPPWLHLARAAWLLIFAAILLVFAVTTAESVATPFVACTTPEAVCTVWTVSLEDLDVARQAGLPVPLLMALITASSWVARLSLTLAALIIFWRKSDDLVALLLSLALTSVLLESGNYYDLGVLTPLSIVLFFIGTCIYLVIPFIFPNGRFVPSWTRWLALPLSLPLALSNYLSLVPQLVWLSGFSIVVWLILAIYAVIYRYRRVANAVERQQIKWVSIGLLVSFLPGIFMIAVVAPLAPPSQPSTGRLAFLLVNLFLYPAGYIFFPLAVGVAVTRYRLWDIDILIRRTLQYSLLTILLALIYFGSVVFLQSIFRAVTGQGQSEIVTVLSTLAIAALFTPLRRRTQAIIDRRFYRRRYDAAQTLANFSTAARDEVDLNELTARLLETVETTMQPAHVSVWLKPAERRGN